MAKLSKRQQRVYECIVQNMLEKGYPPSVREIGDAAGLSSPSTVYFHLTNLEKLGLITRIAGKGRTIRLTRPPQVDRVPVLGHVAAGVPILAQEHIEEYLAFDIGDDPGSYFALRVRGDSMVNAGILSGDLVVVRQQPTAENGEIVVALLGDEATVKRLSRRGKELWLLPENPDYSPINGAGAEILGRVMAVVRRY